MNTRNPATDATRASAPDLASLPLDELRVYAEKLGLEVPIDAHHGELLRFIRQYQRILGELQIEALLDICVWARRPVRKSATTEELAHEISTIHSMRFAGLSDRGLWALCRLRGLDVAAGASRTAMIDHLRKAESWRQFIQRQGRRLVASVLEHLVSPPPRRDAPNEDYAFLPEDQASLRQHIEQEGVVVGLKRRIRGVADDYVREKLDEIELRIDRKLDDIDQRLSEWRDREIRNRLKIIKITLLATIIVAALSLGYDYWRCTMTDVDSEPAPADTISAE